MGKKNTYDQTLIFLVLILSGIGLVMVFSASAMVSAERFGSQATIFIRQSTFIAVGIVTLLVVMKVDYRLYGRPAVVLSSVILAVVMLLIPFLQPPTNEVHRWVDLGGIGFQPSELAKLVLIILTAFYVVHRGPDLNSLTRGVLPFVAISGTIILLVILEPDLGTAFCMALTAGALLWVGGIYYRYAVGACLVGLPTLALLIFLVPYRRDRFWAFLDASHDPFGAGYQVRQSLIALGSGGFSGVGLAQGKQKLFYLPEPHTDFIFSVLGEELGILGCLTVLILFGCFFWKGIQISLRADTRFGTLLGLGVVCMILSQALVNMSVATHLFPTKGIPLPFMSVGGSSMLATLAGVGILLNISRHRVHTADGPVWRQQEDQAANLSSAGS